MSKRKPKTTVFERFERSVKLIGDELRRAELLTGEHKWQQQYIGYGWKVKVEWKRYRPRPSKPKHRMTLMDIVRREDLSGSIHSLAEVMNEFFSPLPQLEKPTTSVITVTRSALPTKPEGK